MLMHKYFLFFLCIILSQTLWAVPTSGLVGLWYFNNNAQDVSGVNTNNGTVYGATLTADRFGNTNSAYSFDGNDYIRIGKPIPSTLQMSTAFAISAWIKPTAIGSELGGIVASQYDPAYSGYSMQMEYRTSAHGGLQSGVHFQVGGGSNYWTNSTEGSTAATMSLNQWHHVVVMAQTNTVYEVYIDGVKVTNWTAEGNIAYNVNCDLLFGANSYNGSLTRYFYGAIDDVAIYNRVLNTSEISQLYTEVVPEPNAIVFLGIGLFFVKYLLKKK